MRVKSWFFVIMFKQMIVLLFVVVIQVSIMGCGKQNSREMPEAGCGTYSMLLSDAEKEFLVFNCVEENSLSGSGI